MANFTVQDLSPKAKAEIAVKLVCLDAIDKGACSADDLTQYMTTTQFKSQVQGYISLMSE